jgi:hypothetical protein
MTIEIRRFRENSENNFYFRVAKESHRTVHLMLEVPKHQENHDVPNLHRDCFNDDDRNGNCWL